MTLLQLRVKEWRNGNMSWSWSWILISRILFILVLIQVCCMFMYPVWVILRVDDYQGWRLFFFFFKNRNRSAVHMAEPQPSVKTIYGERNSSGLRSVVSHLHRHSIHFRNHFRQDGSTQEGKSPYFPTRQLTRAFPPNKPLTMLTRAERSERRDKVLVLSLLFHFYGNPTNA